MVVSQKETLIALCWSLAGTPIACNTELPWLWVSLWVYPHALPVATMMPCCAK